eukprot:TRINITY_DN18686_c0_g1_i1.p1 TRINITY_DN18686_c0_g1~~TRINITY_DN18686_c0_g1_i1.p1  ORF type:complete len:686 (-),score=144.71 TRINITY_DN18686_c0_g1_i1:359-2416(-)
MESSVALERLRRLAMHLESKEPAGSGALLRSLCDSGSLLTDFSSSQPVRKPSAKILADYMAGEYQADRKKVFDFFERHPELVTPVEISKDDHRDLCLRQMIGLVREANVRPMQYLAEDPGRYFSVLDAIGLMDLSLCIKTGVQFSLWGGSVYNLGTQKHRDKYFKGIDNVDYPGCFAMTELNHGSNVQGLETTAIYDPRTDEFIIHTPHDGATKWWIGNAALHGKFASVFARLKLPSSKSNGLEDFGVHAFVVPIRDMVNNSVLPGVTIRDCGFKVGLNGVDNGALKFNNVRIPRDNLLDRFGSVDSNGMYSSALPLLKRFGSTLGELVGGRVALANGSTSVLKTAVTIAVRYGLIRQQFGPPNEPEILILDYQSHQQKLMPLLASGYAFHFATAFLIQRYKDMKKSHDERLVADVHALSAGLKAYISSYTARSLNTCRESCGGHGYAAVNRFGILRNDHDIFQTFEGDNTVLLQQVAADLLKQYKEKFRGGDPSMSSEYLGGESMAKFLTQPNPLARDWNDPFYLRRPDVQKEAFQSQTAKLLHSTALRINSLTAKVGAFEAWNQCLNQVLALAESHVECILLNKFVEAVEKCPYPQERAGLKLVCDLYAVDRITMAFGTSRYGNDVPVSRAKAIQAELEALCGEVRQSSEEFVDAFAIPDFLLRAPIGLKSNQYSEYLQGVGF